MKKSTMELPQTSDVRQPAIAATHLLAAVLSPKDATDFEKVCTLETDNYSTKNYWILTDGSHITICKQRGGEEAEESMSVPLEDFEKLIEWYVKEQPVRNGS